MYIFGIDIPLVELLFALAIIGAIILIEIAVVLILITYHMKNSKKLEEQIENLIHALTVLNKEEANELDKLKEIKKEEASFIQRLRLKRAVKKQVKKKASVKEMTPNERKKMYKQFTKKKKNKVLETVDKFLRRWKK